LSTLHFEAKTTRQIARTYARMDCEWMFGDAGTGALGLAALAHFNPARWSGSLTFSECIDQLSQNKTMSLRPIVLKAPSGIASAEIAFSTQDEAIGWLIDHDPEKQDLKQATLTARSQIKVWEQTKLEIAKQIEDLNTLKAGETHHHASKCEWMYADHKAGRLAQWNPLRWSEQLSFHDSIEQLAKAEARPILLKVPPGVHSKAHKFQTKEEAIAFIKAIDPETQQLKAMEIDQALANAAKKMEDCETKYKGELQRVADLEEKCKVEGIQLDDAQDS